MSLKLDDLIGKKKEAIQVLDLSKATANNADEFKRVMEKVPDFKIKPEKIKPEDVKIQDKAKRWHKKSKKLGYQFADPIPMEMRSLNLDDLCSVPIQWNMLTTLKPKSKIDEEYYSRLVELGKLELAARQKDKKTPETQFLRKMKNKAGVTETRFISCNECGEDFCQRETCHLLMYDNFKREPISETIHKKEEKERGRSKSSSKRGKRRSKSQRRGRSRGRSKSKSKTRSKSRNKSTSRQRSTSRSKSVSKDSSFDNGTPSKPKTGKKKKPKQKSQARNKATSGTKPIKRNLKPIKSKTK
ncbi:serine/arginine-rich splicing factor 10 [Halyomorpha halys]|uniref:serine/arginine-rich splicing factor 10 n=1 Tax=Halyomorpha halys TaxID=286706 RepID=UPI0006D4CC2D|nr:serine/arginine-rich splicing factor 4 [Halyomorpha halys]